MFNEARQILFSETVKYAFPRVKYHMDILREEFSRPVTTETAAGTGNHSLSRSHLTGHYEMAIRKTWNDSAWKGYAFPNRINSSEADELSNTEIKTDGSGGKLDTITSSVFRQVLKFCSSSNSESSPEFLELIQSCYIVHTDVKSRAFFRKHFCQHFGLAFGAAKKAQRALLFLCRFYAAVSTFTEAASRISAFRTISFVPVNCFEPIMNRDEGTSNQALSDALNILGVSTNRDMITARFKHLIEDPAARRSLQHIYAGKGDIIKTANQVFHNIRIKRCHVHAEIQLVDDHENRQKESVIKWRVHPYIGCSKLCCYLCHSFLRHHGFFQYRGTHWKVKPQWMVPEVFQSQPAAMVFERIIRLTYSEVSEHVRSIMRGEEQPSEKPMRADSTVDLTTAATSSSQEVSNMVLKSSMSKWMGKGYVRILILSNTVYQR